jgi:MFS family permease
LLWFGALISMAGSMMRVAALNWHVSLLAPANEKALALGGVGLSRVVPIVVCSLIAGVAADAFDRRKVLLCTNTAMFFISGALAALTLAGVRELWVIYLVSAVSAAASAFDNPARNAFFPQLVPEEHLPNAISLNSILFQAASVIGPVLAGAIISVSNVAWVYVVDALSFAVLVLSLFAMRDVPSRPSHGRLSMGPRAAAEGLRFVFGRPLIRSSMLLDFFATFFASATALLPIFAQDILHVDARGYGLLSAATAAGAVLTSFIMVPAIEHIERRGRTLIVAACVYGLVTIAFGLSTSFWLSFACLFLAGAADMISTVLRQVIRQIATPNEMRGRMTSVNMMFFMGGPQLGELEAGLVAQAFGPVASVVSGGFGCILAVLWLAARTPTLTNYRRELPADARV